MTTDSTVAYLTPFDQAVTHGLSAGTVQQRAVEADNLKGFPSAPDEPDNVHDKPYLLPHLEGRPQRIVELQKLLAIKQETLQSLKQVYEGIRCDGFSDSLHRNAERLITTSHPCYEHRDNPDLIMAYTVAQQLESYAKAICLYITHIQEMTNVLDDLIKEI
ncbi:TPA: hypothetical protein ACGSTL_001251 [Vibrio parahaemolyticus]|uniref:hypothetical protein n=1 Tax=Vibrio campbellii TaxID=680 RepID=UPI001F0772FF|nr:hypothetical protein [Vibrio campbellii]UMM06669.1 hypothetical protein MKR81_27360 [Vibrio campbellii]